MGLIPDVRKRRPRAYWASGIAVVLLAGALAFQFFLKPVERRDSLSSIQLARRLPSDLTGWRMKEIPLGPNEFLERRSAEVLKCDEFVFREFSRRETTFSVFSSHWGQGKMPTRLVSMHTPDRCWIENGWTCPKQVYGANIESESQRLLPAQWRIFNPPQSREDVFVLFWLMIDGKPYEFGQRLNLVPNPIRWWADVIDEARSGSKEHIFIRLTSNRPFEELRGDPGWEELLGALAKLGLGVPPKADGGGRTEEGGGRRAEGGRRRAEGGRRRAEGGRRQTADDRRRTEVTEDGGRRAEDGRRMADDGRRRADGGGRRTDDGLRARSGGGARESE